MLEKEKKTKDSKSVSENKEDEVISSSNQTNFKRTSSAPINTLDLPLKKDFEILDNSILEPKEAKSLNNNENFVKKLLGEKIISESIELSEKTEEAKEPELSLVDKIKFFETPYDKLACISREIGLQIMIDYIINIININKRYIK